MLKINKCEFTGYIGKQGVKLSFAKSTGNAIGSFTLSIPKEVKKGEKAEYSFINVVCFKGNAEFLANNTDKIKSIYVEGALQTRSYKNKEDKTVYVTEIIANRVQVCEWKEAAAATNNESFSAGFTGNDINAYGADLTPVDDGNIPF